MMGNAETVLMCKECGGSMYALPESIEPIYVCSECGCSINEECKQLQQAANPYGNEKKPILTNLFNDQFMRKYTSFPTLSEFIKACGFFRTDTGSISYEMLEQVSRRKFDGYIKKNTRFQSWAQMFDKAVSAYLKI